MPCSIAAAVLRERRRGFVGWLLGALVAAFFVVWAYQLVRATEAVQNLITRFPPQLMAMFGVNPDLMTTAGGFVQAELYGFIGPLMLLTYAIGLGASATTAEEENRTADLLLALPVCRERVILEKSAAMAALLLPIVLVFAGVLFMGNAAADLGLSMRGILAAKVAWQWPSGRRRAAAHWLRPSRRRSRSVPSFFMDSGCSMPRCDGSLSSRPTTGTSGKCPF
jgi:ABC-2 type transport system permease protein